MIAQEPEGINLCYSVRIGIVISIPFVYILSSRWLDRFVYKAEIELWIFAAGITSVLFIALLTISYHSIRAARMNIAERLKSE